MLLPSSSSSTLRLVLEKFITSSSIQFSHFFFFSNRTGLGVDTIVLANVFFSSLNLDEFRLVNLEDAIVVCVCLKHGAALVFEIYSFCRCPPYLFQYTHHDHCFELERELVYVCDQGCRLGDWCPYSISISCQKSNRTLVCAMRDTRQFTAVTTVKGSRSGLIRSY